MGFENLVKSGIVKPYNARAIYPWYQANMYSIIIFLTLMYIAGLQSAVADTSLVDPDIDNQFWVVQGGLEIDDEGGYAVSGGVSYQHSAQTYAGLDFGLSDSSVDLANFEAAFASIRFDHSFGPVGGSLSLGWAGDADIVDRFHYGGSMYFHVSGFRLEITGEKWNSSFDTFEFSRTLERNPPLRPLVVTGTAKCDMDNTVLGGRLAYAHDMWNVYVAATSYNYSRADCSFTGMLGDINLRNPPDALARFSPIFFRRLAISTASRIINSDAAFLDRSYSAGVSFQAGEKNLALDYFHAKEIFERFKADTVMASILFPVGFWGDLELHLGVTNHDVSGTVGFVGATVFWYVGM